MIDPLKAIAAIEAAYLLPATDPTVIDVIYGQDLDGERPYGVVYMQDNGRPLIGICGTRDFFEWVEDAKVLPETTPLGVLESGFWDIFKTFRLGSGKDLSTYAGGDVSGHSLGAALAAYWAASVGCASYQLFACPRGLSSAVVGRLNATDGMAYAEAGDPVPHVPLFAYHTPPRVQFLTPGGSGDWHYHHALATYKASLIALQNQIAA